jgi:NADPH2:quinone reductase
MDRFDAVICSSFAGIDALGYGPVERRALGDGEVRIAVTAAGLNFADTLMVAGQYQVKPPFPFVPGLEAAGVVREVGPGVTGLAVGQRVAAFTPRGGAFADEVVADARLVAPLPDAVDDVTAAAMPTTYGTAHLALIHRGHLAAGETLLVLGASGGVGLAAVEVGALLGADVIAAASSDDKLAVARAHGARHLLNYTTGGIKEQVRAVTAGRGANVVFDAVGGDAFDEALRALDWEGRMLVIGFAAGRIPSAPANILLVKNLSVIGVILGSHAERNPAWAGAMMRDVFAWHAEGRLEPHVSATFDMREAPAAMHALRSRKHTGKVVLVNRAPA